MRKTVVLLIAGLIAAIGGAAAGKYFRPPLPPHISEAQLQLLEVSPKALNLGRVIETPSLVVSLPITNHSTNPLTLRELKASCACISIDSEPVVIDPGQTHIARVRLDITDASPLRASGLAFSAAVWPVVDDNAVGTQPPWVITGSVVKLITLSPKTAEFGEVAKSCLPAGPVKILVDRSQQLSGVTLADYFVNPDWEVILKPVDGQPQYEIIARSPKQLPVGAHQLDVPLRLLDRDGKDAGTTVLPLRIVVTEDVTVTPAAVVLGGCSQGEVLSEVVTLQSYDNSPFEVISAESSHSSLKVKLLPQQSCIAIEQTASEIGNIRNSFSVVIRHRLKQLTLTVPVSFLCVRKS